MLNLFLATAPISLENKYNACIKKAIDLTFELRQYAKKTCGNDLNGYFFNSVLYNDFNIANSINKDFNTNTNYK